VAAICANKDVYICVEIMLAARRIHRHAASGAVGRANVGLCLPQVGNNIHTSTKRFYDKANIMSCYRATLC